MKPNPKWDSASADMSEAGPWMVDILLGMGTCDEAQTQWHLFDCWRRLQPGPCSIACEKTREVLLEVGALLPKENS